MVLIMTHHVMLAWHQSRRFRKLYYSALVLCIGFSATGRPIALLLGVLLFLASILLCAGVL